MKKKATVLIVDDDPDVLFTARAILRKQFETVETLDNPERIPRVVEKTHPEVVVLDMNFKTGATTGQEGLFWLRKIKSISPNAHVVMNTAYGDIPLAVECMKEGAIDFLVKPWEKEKLLSTVSAVYELQQSKQQVHKLKHTEKVLSEDLGAGYSEMISKAKSMQPILSTMNKVAKTDASVLILGENGTGKELIARAIHKSSERSDKSFIKVDLGSITQTLFESELFGHLKGAFTDAKEDKPGRFELAHEGTIFLDEIGNLDINLQAKLLTVLQNREVFRVGGSKPIPVDIRLICATNSPIEELANAGDFRVDLLYRINTVTLELPPLRKRIEDIQPMLTHFLKQYGEKYEKNNLEISEDAMEKLKEYPWPGNVRELQNAVERAVIMSDTNILEATDFLLSKTIKPIQDSKSFNVEDVEKQTIISALDETNGKLSEAANILGIGRTTLYRKMKKYGLSG